MQSNRIAWGLDERVSLTGKYRKALKSDMRCEGCVKMRLLPWRQCEAGKLWHVQSDRICMQDD